MACDSHTCANTSLIGLSPQGEGDVLGTKVRSVIVTVLSFESRHIFQPQSCPMIFAEILQ